MCVGVCGVGGAPSQAANNAYEPVNGYVNNHVENGFTQLIHSV